MQGSLNALLTAYTPLWDEFGEDCLATRRRMRPKVAELVLETRNAVRRITGSDGACGGTGGGASSSVGAACTEGGGGDEYDDDVVDTTEANQQIKRQRLLESTIDLSDTDEPLQPLQVNVHAAPRGPVKVKSEVKSEQ